MPPSYLKRTLHVPDGRGSILSVAYRSEFGDRSRREERIPISQLTFEFNGVWQKERKKEREIEWSCGPIRDGRSIPKEGVKRGRSGRYGGGQGMRTGGGLSERDKLLR